MHVDIARPDGAFISAHIRSATGHPVGERKQAARAARHQCLAEELPRNIGPSSYYRLGRRVGSKVPNERRSPWMLLCSPLQETIPYMLQVSLAVGTFRRKPGNIWPHCLCGVVGIDAD